MLAVLVIVIGVTPAAFALNGLQALFLIPIAIAVYIVRVRTTASADGLSVRTMVGRRDLRWDELKGMSLTGRGNVRAVTTAGEEVRLPSVRTRHLPVLSLISGGRLPDPSGLTDDLTSDEAAGETESAPETGTAAADADQRPAKADPAT